MAPIITAERPEKLRLHEKVAKWWHLSICATLPNLLEQCVHHYPLASRKERDRISSKRMTVWIQFYAEEDAKMMMWRENETKKKEKRKKQSQSRKPHGQLPTTYTKKTDLYLKISLEKIDLTDNRTPSFFLFFLVSFSDDRYDQYTSK